MRRGRCTEGLVELGLKSPEDAQGWGCGLGGYRPADRAEGRHLETGVLGLKRQKDEWDGAKGHTGLRERCAQC